MYTAIKKYKKPIKILNNKQFVYIARRHSNLILGNFVDIYKVYKDKKLRTKAMIELDYNKIPYDTYLLSECPENLK